jgi:transposase
MCHWVVQVVLRSQEHKGFVLLPKRWVVEQHTIGRELDYFSVPYKIDRMQAPTRSKMGLISVPENINK